MMVLMFLLGLILGIGGGVLATSLMAASKIDELNRTWYGIANRITDGVDADEPEDTDHKEEE